MSGVKGVGGNGAITNRDDDDNDGRFHDVDVLASGHWPESLRGAATGKLVDHGGKVLDKMDVTPVYVGDYWKTAPGQKIRAHNDAAMADLVKNPDVTGIWAQYGVGKATISPSLGLPMANPKSLSQDQIEALVKQQVLKGKFDISNHQRVFDLVLPPGCALIAGDGSSSHAGLGGFHGSVKVAGREIYYSAIANPEKVRNELPNSIDFNGNTADGLSIIESHELTEAATDPDVEVAERNNDLSKLAWYDDVTTWAGRRGKGEIGDIPILNAELGGDRKLATAWGYSDGFAYQKEWSNKDKKSELKPGE
ncbi:MAG: hypothetical protein QM723_36900 [Myxococcaceae bacterium]